MILELVDQKAELVDWEAELSTDPEEEYEDLIRALKRTKGFSLLFIRCSHVQGKQLITRTSEDIPKKTIKVLKLEELEQPSDNLFNTIEEYINYRKINILFITGIEKSLEPYIRPGYGGQGNYYKLDTVPRILGYLNLQRERFRDKFNICFVFILPLFALKYFIHRAPDFFDWRSGVFEFPRNRELLEQESLRIIEEGYYQKYFRLTFEEKRQKILEIQELLEEKHQTLDCKADLLFEVGNLLYTSDEYEAAIASYEQALEIKPYDYKAWYKYGVILHRLGRYKEAANIYNKAIELKPDEYHIWNSRGNVVCELELYEDAIKNYEKAIEFNPTYYWSWFNLGNALRELGNYEQALTSFNKAVELRPNSFYAWNYRGLVLYKLGYYQEAITSYDMSIKFNSNYYWAWSNKGNVLYELGSYEQALTSYNKAAELRPNSYNTRKNREDVLKKLGWYNQHQEWQSQGNYLYKFHQYEKALDHYNKALKIKPDYESAWYKRGLALQKLYQYGEAILSYDKALKIKPSHYRIWISRGDTLQKIGNYEEAIASYDKSLEIEPSKYQTWQKRGDAFVCLGNYEEAVHSYDKALNIKPNLYIVWFNKSIAFVLLKWQRLSQLLVKFLRIDLSRKIEDSED